MRELKSIGEIKHLKLECSDNGDGPTFSLSSKGYSPLEAVGILVTATTEQILRSREVMKDG